MARADSTLSRQLDVADRIAVERDGPDVGEPIA
jgi:hypothetical protein